MWPFGKKKKNKAEKLPPKKYVSKNDGNPNNDYLNQWGVHEIAPDESHSNRAEQSKTVASPRFDRRKG